MNEKAGISDYDQLAQRVTRAVEVENRGRRRAAGFFFLLLLVPVAVLMVILQKGMTDSEWVQENARVAVQPELKAVRKTANEINDALPEVRQAISVVEDANERIEVVEHRQAEQGEAQQAMLVRLDRQQRTMSQIAERVRDPVATRDPRVDELLERLHVLEREQENTRRDLIRTMELGGVREPEDLEDRLSVIERRLQINR